MERFLETLSVSELIPILNSINDAVFIDSSDGYSLWCNCLLYTSPPPQVQSPDSSRWIFHAAYQCIKKESPDLVYCTTCLLYTSRCV